MRKKIPLHHTLRFKLIVAMVLIESIMLAILVWNNARLAEKALIEQTQIRVQDVLPLLNTSLAGPLLQEDFARLNEIGEQVVVEHNVSYLRISNTTRDIFLEFGEVKIGGHTDHPHAGFDLQHFKSHLSESSPGELYRFTEKIMLEGYRVGLMEIGYDTTTIVDALSVSRQSGIAIASIEIFLSIFLLFLVGITFTRRLGALGDAAGEMAEGDLSVRLPITGHDEVSQTAIAFNQMVEKIEHDRLQLSESERNLSLTLDSIGDAVIATDTDGKVTRMNPIAEQLTGWSLNDAKGRQLEDVFPVIDELTRESIENPVNKVLATGNIISLSNHTTLIAKDGAEYQIADSAAPIRNDQGEIIGTILVFHDVSEQYRLRQAADESKERLLLHREQTPLGVIEWNTNFEVVDWNLAAERIFGFKKEEVQGRHATECILPEILRDEINIVWRELLQNAGGAHNTNENMTKDGRTILCEWFNTPLIDKNGNVVGVASLVDDITERKQTQLKLQQHQQNLEKILNTMQVGIITIDERGHILNFNNMAEAMFEYTTDEVVGENVSMLMPDPHKQKHDSYLSHYLETGEAHVIGIGRELFAQRKSGDLFPMRLSVVELLNAEGGYRQFMGSCVDLTLQRQQEEQLRRTQKMDVLGKLTGGIAHDYNNMLGVIIGYSELLQEGLTGDPKLSSYATEIQHAGQRGSKLTQKLLAFSRYKVAEAESIELNELLKDEQHMLEKTLTPRIKLIMNLTSDIWMIYLDSSDLEDTLLNIIINAMHAMETAGTLTLATRNEYLVPEEANNLGLPSGDYVILSITDTGTGMDQEIQNRMFDPFFTTKGDQGTGLGLSQVYSFMQRCKGAIHVYSEPGHGSRFSLYFPRFRQKDDFSSTQIPVEVTDYQGDESILVVDDEQALRELTSEIFRTQGYRVLCAENGEAALKVLETERVDLVLTDVIMQGMDGYQLASKIAEKYPQIKIQLASGFNENRHKDLIDDDLHRQALQKPYSTHVLLKRVRELLD